MKSDGDKGIGPSAPLHVTDTNSVDYVLSQARDILARNEKVFRRALDQRRLEMVSSFSDSIADYFKSRGIPVPSEEAEATALTEAAATGVEAVGPVAEPHAVPANYLRGESGACSSARSNSHPLGSTSTNGGAPAGTGPRSTLGSGTAASTPASHHQPHQRHPTLPESARSAPGQTAFTTTTNTTAGSQYSSRSLTPNFALHPYAHSHRHPQVQQQTALGAHGLRSHPLAFGYAEEFGPLLSSVTDPSVTHRYVGGGGGEGGAAEGEPGASAHRSTGSSKFSVIPAVAAPGPTVAPTIHVTPPVQVVPPAPMRGFTLPNILTVVTGNSPLPQDLGEETALAAKQGGGTTESAVVTVAATVLGAPAPSTPADEADVGSHLTIPSPLTSTPMSSSGSPALTNDIEEEAVAASRPIAPCPPPQQRPQRQGSVGTEAGTIPSVRAPAAGAVFEPEACLARLASVLDAIDAAVERSQCTTRNGGDPVGEENDEAAPGAQFIHRKVVQNSSGTRVASAPLPQQKQQQATRPHYHDGCAGGGGELLSGMHGGAVRVGRKVSSVDSMPSTLRRSPGEPTFTRSPDPHRGSMYSETGAMNDTQSYSVSAPGFQPQQQPTTTARRGPAHVVSAVAAMMGGPAGGERARAAPSTAETLTRSPPPRSSSRHTPPAIAGASPLSAHTTPVHPAQGPSSGPGSGGRRGVSSAAATPCERWPEYYSLQSVASAPSLPATIGAGEGGVQVARKRAELIERMRTKLNHS